MPDPVVDLGRDPRERLARWRREVVPQAQEVGEEEGSEEAGRGTIDSMFEIGTDAGCSRKRDGWRRAGSAMSFLVRRPGLNRTRRSQGQEDSRVLESDRTEEDSAKDDNDLDVRHEQHRLLVMRLDPRLDITRVLSALQRIVSLIQSARTWICLDTFVEVEAGGGVGFAAPAAAAGVEGGLGRTVVRMKVTARMASNASQRPH